MDSQNFNSEQARSLLRKFGTSKLFLSAVIVYSVMILTQVLSLFTTRWDSIMDTFNLAFNNIPGYNAGDVIYNMADFMKIYYYIGIGTGLIALICPALIGVGLWLHYLASKDTSSNQIKTTGLSIIRIITIINLVFMCVGIGLVLIFMIIAIVIIFGASFMEDATAAGVLIAFLIAYFAFIFIIVAGVIAFYIIYYLQILSTIKSIMITASTGKAEKKVSLFVPIVGFITAANQLFSVLYLIFFIPFYSFLMNTLINQYDIYGELGHYMDFSNLLPVGTMIVSIFTMLLSSAFLVLISIGLLMYRSKLNALSKYTPPPQNYIPSQNLPKLHSPPEERRQEPFVPPQ